MQKDSEKVVFVILHYITMNDTARCVQSIKRYTPNSRIVIVDNASPNKSLEELKQMYSTDSRITILHCEKNLGFARGNNIGFYFAKKEYNPEFIVLCNNDTQITNSDFIDKLKAKYLQSHFAVLGPREQLPNGKYYPLMSRVPSLKETKKEIHLLEFKLKHPSLAKLHDYKERLINRIRKTVHSSKILDYNIEHHNIVLHGAFLVFSQEYIKKFDGLDDRTFLYCEEQLLAIRLQKNNLTSIYDPSITILHTHHSSTDAATNRLSERIHKRTEHELESTKIVLSELQANRGKYE